MAVTAAAVVAAGASAYSSVQQGRAARRATQQANQPQERSQASERSPYAPTIPFLQEILEASQNQFRNPTALPNFRGGGASDTSENILAQILGLRPPQTEAPTAGSFNQFIQRELAPAAQRRARLTEQDIREFGGAHQIAQLDADPQGYLQQINRAAASRPDTRLGAILAQRNADSGGQPQGLEFNNEITTNLFNRLSGGNEDGTRDLIERFLGDPGGPAAGPLDSAAAPSNGTRSNGTNVYSRPSSFVPTRPNERFVPGSSSSISGGGGGSGRIAIPDLSNEGFFGEQIRAFFDPSRLDPANDPTLQPVLDLMQREAEQDFANQRGALEARVEAQGRFGSGTHRAGLGAVSDSVASALNDSRTGLLHSTRRGALEDQLQALGLLGSANANALDNITSRHNARTSADATRSAAASANSSAERIANSRIDLERELGRRGQDLSALQLLQGGDQFGLGLLGNLSGDLNATRLGASNLSLGQQNLFQEGDQFGADFGLRQLLAAAGISQGNDSANSSAANARYRADLERANQPRQSLDDYFRRIVTIAGLGGTENTQGVSPGANAPVPSRSALLTQALLGGLSTFGGINAAFAPTPGATPPAGFRPAPPPPTPPGGILV